MTETGTETEILNTQARRESVKTQNLAWVMISRVVPYGLSAVFFLSAFFSLFSPAPLVAVGLRRGWGHALLAAAVNTLWVYVLGGAFGATLFIAFVGVTGVAIAAGVRAGRTPWGVGGGAFAGVVVAALTAWFVASWVRHESPVHLARTGVQEMVDQISAALSPEAREQWVGDGTPEEVRDRLLVELPSAAGIFAMVLIWVNLLIVARLTPGLAWQLARWDPGYFRRWRAPEILVWPTIFFGVGLVFDLGAYSWVALNGFKMAMALYALQGLSVLAFFFEVWKLAGPLRSLFYAVALFVMLPLVLAIGFFDLWFDFRSKLRQP